MALEPHLANLHMQYFPLHTPSRKALYSLRDLVKPNNKISLWTKIRTTFFIVRQAANPNKCLQLSLNSHNAVIHILDVILQSSETAIDDIVDIQELSNIRYQVNIIKDWINFISYDQWEELPYAVAKKMHIEVAKSVWTKLHLLSLKSYVRESMLKNPDRPIRVLSTRPNILENFTDCSIIRRKLGQLTVELVRGASEDLCMLCKKNTISLQHDFAILDTCPHLFCQQCFYDSLKDS